MAAWIIAANESAFRHAPPTSAPSISGWWSNSFAFSGFTLPPYWRTTFSAVAQLYNCPISFRISWWTSCACCELQLCRYQLPHRLVRNYQFLDICGRNIFQTSFHLHAYDLIGNIFSRSSNVSPTQIIGTNPEAMAFFAFLLMNSFVSLKYWPPFWMSEYNILASSRFQHFSARLHPWKHLHPRDTLFARQGRDGLPSSNFAQVRVR